MSDDITNQLICFEHNVRGGEGPCFQCHVDDSSESLSDDFEAALAEFIQKSDAEQHLNFNQREKDCIGMGADFARTYTLTKDPVVLGLVAALKFSQTTIPPEAWWEKNEGTRVHKSAVKMREALAAFAKELERLNG